VIESPDYTILVSSTGSFADMRAPFFHLLNDFWPQSRPDILNTEAKSFSRPDVPITCTQIAGEDETDIPCGEYMLRALDHIPNETFVYPQALRPKARCRRAGHRRVRSGAISLGCRSSRGTGCGRCER